MKTSLIHSKKMKIAGCLAMVGMVFAFSYSIAEASTNESHSAAFITGLSGSETKYERYFNLAQTKLKDLLLANGYMPNEIYRFADKNEAGINWVHQEISGRVSLQSYFQKMKDGGPVEEFFLFIAGHANGHDENAMLQLPGEDISYEELMKWIDQVPAKRMTLIIALSQGESWIKTLSKSGRIIIAGTGLRQFDFAPVLFLRLFPDMFWNAVSSTNDQTKSAATQNISLADVFMETQKKVQNWYWMNSLEPTEVALIDSDGDGVGHSLILRSKPIENVHAEKAAEIKKTLAPKETKSETAVEDRSLGLEFTMDLKNPDVEAARQIYFLRPGGGQSHGNQVAP